ncbi:uncharacterized protein LOC114358368 [Ostrinia furnacalis]|uniref:uncharacterized protein LOC114358368 n=1 Tax=Ostrinia furnacalis TaxID=93504 RepID=UPI00103E46E0|nr:uncharacterized protein LOC114358368 [Ostrinia furnacalis]
MGVGNVTITADAYVLLQVSKDGQNRSNVDALIHKVVPPGKADAITRMARKQFSQNREKLEPVASEDEVQDTMKEFVEKNAELRTKDFRIKPQVIHFRSDQPSLMYEVNANVLIKALKDFLSSKLVAQYTDDVAKRAAVVYRSLNKKEK